MLGKNLIQAASGAAGAAGGLDISEIFSTWLYTGTGSTQTITNGIDLAGEGGLVWIKQRNGVANHYWFDTERGASHPLFSDSTAAQGTNVNLLPSFNSDGFTVGTGGTNPNTATMASWTFRKAPGFFDVVTYTGDGQTSRMINHNLGSVPGCIIIKRLQNASNWAVYHRSTGNTDVLLLNDTEPTQSSPSVWNNTTPTSTVFTVGSSSLVNASGDTYVAYLFAHDEQIFGEGGDQSVIKCGSFTHASGGVTVDLGWEPQWILTKNINSSSYPYDGWSIYDSMRGMVIEGNDPVLYANLSDAELTTLQRITLNPTGFKVDNEAYSTYIYIAIRRGPMKTPTSGTEVFATDTQNSGPYNAAPYYRSGFVVDAQLLLYKPGTSSAFPWLSSRLTGSKNLKTALTSAEDTNATINKWDYMNGFSGGEIFSDDSNHVSHMFRRAPGFFDVVAYTGTGSAGQTVPHNLTVVPELMIIKRRNANDYDWIVYHSALGNQRFISLNKNDPQSTASSQAWNSTTPTAAVFTLGTLGDLMASGGTYIAYLFAACPGVSKVGSYTGTGTTLNIDCGFTSGARFVLIKRTDSTGDWYVWDTARGIVSGNDPYLLLNSTAAEVTSTDYIDPLSSGFQISSTAPAAINNSGGSYIYFSVA